MNIMFASHTYIGGPFVVGSHHLAREMGKLGHSVIHISTPVTPFHLLKFKDKDYRERFQILRGKRKGKQLNLVNAVPLSWIPWQLAGPLFKHTGKNWMLPSVKKLLKQNKISSIDLLFIDQPSFVGMEKLVDSKLTIYRPTDSYSKMTGDKNVAAAEKAILSRADGLVSTSSPVLSELEAYNPGIPTLLLENGVEFDHFSQATSEPAEYDDIPHPRAVYLGVIDQRLDLPALYHLAEEMPEVSVIIIGPCSASTAQYFAGCRNVYLLGAKAYETIPSYLHYADVALLPLSKHAANLGRSPMKLYEYAAAGLPVVVAETPELLRREEAFIHFYKECSEFPGRVRDALQMSPDKESIRILAKKHAWNTKVAELLEFVKNL